MVRGVPNLTAGPAPPRICCISVPQSKERITWWVPCKWNEKSQITKFVSKNMNGALETHGVFSWCMSFGWTKEISSKSCNICQQTICVEANVMLLYPQIDLWQSCGVCFVKDFTTWVACGLEISVECLGRPAFFSWGGCMQNRTFPWHQCEHRLRKVCLKFKSTTCPLKIDF